LLGKFGSFPVYEYNRVFDVNQNFTQVRMVRKKTIEFIIFYGFSNIYSKCKRENQKGNDLIL
jgi:hypothetical protein